MTEYLPQHGVGGAYFGAHLSAQSLTWQGDLNYVTYRPGLFRDAPFIRPGEKMAPAEAAVEKIRVLVRDGVGILLSSLAGLPVRVLVPPTNTRSERELNELVIEAVPPPFRVLVPSVHFGLLSVASSKAVYIFNPKLRRDGTFSVKRNRGRTAMGAVTRLMETLESITPPGFFDLTIVTEADTAAQTYRITMPTD